MDRHGWAWHDSLSEKYGLVCKMHGMFGVSTSSVRLTMHTMIRWLLGSQGRALIVMDPKAIHNVMVKDQDVYEEADWFIQCV